MKNIILIFSIEDTDEDDEKAFYEMGKKKKTNKDEIKILHNIPRG